MASPGSGSTGLVPGNGCIANAAATAYACRAAAMEPGIKPTSADKNMADHDQG
jgi:hypothetical protein